MTEGAGGTRGGGSNSCFGVGTRGREKQRTKDAQCMLTRSKRLWLEIKKRVVLIFPPELSSTKGRERVCRSGFQKKKTHHLGMVLAG